MALERVRSIFFLSGIVDPTSPFWSILSEEVHFHTLSNFFFFFLKKEMSPLHKPYFYFFSYSYENFDQ